MPFEKIQDRALGKWRSLLPQLGIPAAYLTNKHGPCPCCGGNDRFRFDDKAGSGSYYCNGCGPGSAVDLVMKVNKIDFITAKKLIEQHLPDAQVVVPKARRGIDPVVFVNQWRAAQHLSGEDPASWWLANRGIDLMEFPRVLRFAQKATYRHDAKTTTQHPAMLSLFTSPDMAMSTVHFTFLDHAGHKAALPTTRKLAPCPVPTGGAVRLAPSAPTMGIAEGIETALAAAQIHDVPVWAALTAGALIKWQPPPTARHILIFGDRDRNYAGQAAAANLAHRLSVEGYHVEVRLPVDFGDWNDQLIGEKAAYPTTHQAPLADPLSVFGSLA